MTGCRVYFRLYIFFFGYRLVGNNVPYPGTEPSGGELIYRPAIYGGIKLHSGRGVWGYCLRAIKCDRGGPFCGFCNTEPVTKKMYFRLPLCEGEAFNLNIQSCVNFCTEPSCLACHSWVPLLPRLWGVPRQVSDFFPFEGFRRMAQPSSVMRRV